jgi:hypothetical protein
VSQLTGAQRARARAEADRRRESADTFGEASRGLLWLWRLARRSGMRARDVRVQAAWTMLAQGDDPLVTRHHDRERVSFAGPPLPLP